MKKRTNGIGQFLSYLAHMSTAMWADEQPNNGRPVYPYKIETTKAERMAHVKRRQSNNGSYSGQRNFEHWLKGHMKSHGPSRKMFVDRTDGGCGP